MKKYIGTKIINAKTMNRLDYNIFRGWELPKDENGEDEGYLIEYIDGGQSNTDEYQGYVSWSPKDVFEKSYRETYNMTFSDALIFLKRGISVSRKSWDRCRIFLVPGTRNCLLQSGSVYANQLGVDTCNIYPHIDMLGRNDEEDWALPSWSPSQEDILSEDWYIY